MERQGSLKTSFDSCSVLGKHGSASEAASDSGFSEE